MWSFQINEDRIIFQRGHWDKLSFLDAQFTHPNMKKPNELGPADLASLGGYPCPSQATLPLGRLTVLTTELRDFSAHGFDFRHPKPSSLAAA